MSRLTHYPGGRLTRGHIDSYPYCLAAAALQAGGQAVPGRLPRLSGATPGEPPSGSWHRVSLATLRVGPLTPDETGWSAPPLSSTASVKSVACGLAAAFLAGPWRLDDLIERGGQALGRRWRWLRPL